MAGETSGSPFNAAELGALAHLYRGEMYRSKIWRVRLDVTTNWAITTTGIALSLSFSSATNSPLPIILISLLVTVFLAIEARRYRYFDIWRTRVRLMEVCLFGPILRGEGARVESKWNEVLARDYERLHFHISFWEAAGRRLRRNYAWIFVILAISFLAKIAIHPEPVRSLDQLCGRAAIGPIPGQVTLLVGALWNGALLLLGLLTLRGQHATGRVGGPEDQDPTLAMGIEV